MPYTDNPAEVAADEVRFLVGDTDVANSRLTDNQVIYLLQDQGGDPRKAAARAAETLAARYSREASEKQVGPLRLRWLTDQYDRYSKLAKALWARSAATSGTPYAGGIDRSDKETNRVDPTRVRPAFTRRGMKYRTGGDTYGRDYEDRLGDY